jgi:hypothetical protein
LGAGANAVISRKLADQIEPLLMHFCRGTGAGGSMRAAACSLALVAGGGARRRVGTGPTCCNATRRHC